MLAEHANGGMLKWNERDRETLVPMERFLLRRMPFIMRGDAFTMMRLGDDAQNCATEDGIITTMSSTFTDLKQLSRTLLKKSPPLRVDPMPVEKPVVDEGAEVLAYFSRPSQNAPRTSRVASEARPGVDRVAELEAALEAKDSALNAIAEEKVEADERIAELERQHVEEHEALQAAVHERDRLQGECGRLQGELRKRDENAPVDALDESAPVAPAEPTKPARGVLVTPVAIGEVFPGEVREQVLATLQDGLDAAKQSGRERRAEILQRVLAVNESFGELDRRRAELKQILKDAGGFADASTLAALERLGIRCISGRKHWKLEYANVRMPMAKTPSDYRSAQNTASDMANRCF